MREPEYPPFSSSDLVLVAVRIVFRVLRLNLFVRHAVADTRIELVQTLPRLLRVREVS